MKAYSNIWVWWSCCKPEYELIKSDPQDVTAPVLYRTVESVKRRLRNVIFFLTRPHAFYCQLKSLLSFKIKAFRSVKLFFWCMCMSLLSRSHLFRDFHTKQAFCQTIFISIWQQNITDSMLTSISNIYMFLWGYFVTRWVLLKATQIESEVCHLWHVPHCLSHVCACMPV